MTRKWWIAIAVAALAAAAVTVGIAAGRAQGSPTLQELSVAQLLAKVAAAPRTQTEISGDVAWSNGLIPGSGLSSLLGGQSSAPTSLNGLALGGSGRLWLKRGSGLRLEVQGSDGDFVVVAGKQGLWSYSSATDAATHYSLPTVRSTSASELNPQGVPADLPATIASALGRFAAIGRVTLGPQTSVAGEPCYLVILTPTSTTTSVGSLQVAVDAKTFVPLRVQVFAKGGGSAVLSAGFTSISYGRLDASLFDFVAPAGATVDQGGLPQLGDVLGGSAEAAPDSETPTASREGGDAMTLAQTKAAARRCGISLALPKTPATVLPFTGAEVSRPTATRGPIVLLHYGSGFGSIVLVESKGAGGALGRADAADGQSAAYAPGPCDDRRSTRLGAAHAAHRRRFLAAGIHRGGGSWRGLSGDARSAPRHDQVGVP
jgi:outer membrane lipoprotein-sorting protein